MITKENLEAVIEQINDKDKKRIRVLSKDYVVLFLHSFNAGSYTEVILTNDYNKYMNVSNKGGCILELNDQCFDKLKGD